MKDLTKLTPVETQECVDRLASLSLEELRQRMDLASAQLDWAKRQKDDAAVANLQIVQEHLRQALQAIVSGQSRPGRKD